MSLTCAARTSEQLTVQRQEAEVASSSSSDDIPRGEETKVIGEWVTRGDEAASGKTEEYLAKYIGIGFIYVF